MKMRAAGITFASLALTSAVIGNAYYHKKQFYPSVVYITKSNPSMAVMYIQAFIMVYLLGKLMRKIFFGELLPAEFEHLMERSWYAVTETCLAFTVFRDDFSPKFVALFTLLLFLKSFHWLAEDRVDYMERSTSISLVFHIRVLALLTLLGALDLAFVHHAYHSTMTKGASVQLVFGFEYAILATVILNISIKYALHTFDLQNEVPWENKAVFLLYTELVMGLIKVILYVTFVMIMVRLYTLPLFAFRPMYYTMRKFKQAYNDVILSRRAIQNMNTLYPDATPEELAAADSVCIICREEMTTACKKLPCNHIFHTACLRSWFQRQQTCPTCRLNILRTPTPQPAMPQRPFPFWQQPPAPPGGAPPVPGPPGPSDARPQPPRFTPMPPPFYPPMMGLFPPPPMPPADFTGLSDEELARMEGDARRNVEARLQCLRQIELLMHAAGTVMAQYLTVAPAAVPLRPGSTTNPTAGPSTSEAATTSEPVSSDSTVTQPTPSPAPSTPVSSVAPPSSPVSTATSSSNSSDNSSEDVTASTTSGAPSTTTSTAGPTASQQEEIRRLRLQRIAPE